MQYIALAILSGPTFHFPCGYPVVVAHLRQLAMFHDFPKSSVASGVLCRCRAIVNDLERMSQFCRLFHHDRGRAVFLMRQLDRALHMSGI